MSAAEVTVDPSKVREMFKLLDIDKVRTLGTILSSTVYSSVFAER